MPQGSSSSSSKTQARADRSPESNESLRIRNAAAEILQSYEKLSWLSYLRCESLSQTRLHYQNVIAGFTAQDEAAMVEWPTDNSPRPNQNDDNSSSRRKTSSKDNKGKERVSSGGASPSNAASPAAGTTNSDSNSKKKRKSNGKS